MNVVLNTTGTTFTISSTLFSNWTNVSTMTLVVNGTIIAITQGALTAGNYVYVNPAGSTVPFESGLYNFKLSALYTNNTVSTETYCFFNDFEGKLACQIIEEHNDDYEMILEYFLLTQGKYCHCDKAKIIWDRLDSKLNGTCTC
jgi:hypothetical protein